MMRGPRATRDLRCRLSKKVVRLIIFFNYFSWLLRALAEKADLVFSMEAASLGSLTYKTTHNFEREERVDFVGKKPCSFNSICLSI